VNLTRAIPLPFVARGQGVKAVFPGDAAKAAIFDVLGNAVECESKVEYDLLAAASALMATYFGILHRTTEWLAQNGLPGLRLSRAPVCRPFRSGNSRRQGCRFRRLSREFATNGGLNEQMFRDFDERGGIQALTRALGRVFDRINNR